MCSGDRKVEENRSWTQFDNSKYIVFENKSLGELQRQTVGRGWGGRKRKQNSNPFPSQFYPSNPKFIYCFKKEGESKSGMTTEGKKENIIMMYTF